MGARRGLAGLAGSYEPTTPADWTDPPPTTIADALDEIAAGGNTAGSSAPSLLWTNDPAAVAGGNVFKTWAALKTELQKIKGLKFVATECAIGALHITAGAFAGITDVYFIAAGKQPIQGLIIADDGATFTGTHQLTFDGVILEYAGTAAPFISTADGELCRIDCRNAGAIAQTAGQPVWHSGGTGKFVGVADTDAAYGTGTLNAAAAGSNITLLLFNGSTLESGAITGALGPAAAVALDGSSACLTAQALGFTTQAVTPSFNFVDPPTSFVLAPGSTLTDSNVFQGWSALGPLLAAMGGLETQVLCDPRLGAISIDNSAPIADNITFSQVWDSLATIEIAAGAAMAAGASTIRFQRISVELNAGALGEFLTLPDGHFFVMECSDNAFVSNATANAPIQVITGAGNARFLLTQTEDCEWGDTVHPMIQTDGTSSFLSQSYNFSSVAAAAVTGTGTFIEEIDASSTPFSSQTVTTHTRVFLGAAPNFQQAAGNTGTGSGTVTATTPNIAKQTTGQMNAAGSCAGSVSGASTVTAQLKRDATPIGSAESVTLAGAGTFSLSVGAIDTAPDFANHTYQLAVTASGGATLTVAATSAQVRVSEGG